MTLKSKKQIKNNRKTKPKTKNNELSQWSIKFCARIDLCYSVHWSLDILGSHPSTVIANIAAAHHRTKVSKLERTRSRLLERLKIQEPDQLLQSYCDLKIHDPLMSFGHSVVGRYPRIVARYGIAVGRYRTGVRNLKSTWSRLLRTSKISRIDPIAAKLCWFEKS